MLGFITGAYDILRQNDLNRMDRAIQENLEKGNKYFALGIYEDELCEQLGLGTPLKSIEDRKKIAECLSGVDFVFSIYSKNPTEIRERAEQALKDHIEREKVQKVINSEGKKYDIVYAPGTYDLFHAGHLENLLLAANSSQRVIVGVKSDELVERHKGKKTIIKATERMEILRHFSFVTDVYQYYTRDPHAAAKWIQSRYGKEVDAIFLGSDLKNDFKNIKDMNLVFTDRPKEVMESRSTTAYRRRLHTPAKGGENKYTKKAENKSEVKLEEEIQML